MIDTPGVLSGEKQRTDRGYDFVGVLQWFAERVDRIILLFDANKLDISDEFRRSIEAIHGYEDKVRIVLNKADQIDHQELMRVYGALMWSISKVLTVPECPKVFIGSFWDQQLKHDVYRNLFEKELQSLFDDLQDLPRYAAMRKINDFIKRARMAKVHAYIISSLKKDMPKFFGKNRKKRELIKRLPQLLQKIREDNMVAMSDLPDLANMQERLSNADFTTFPLLKEKLISQAGCIHFRIPPGELFQDFLGSFSRDVVKSSVVDPDHSRNQELGLGGSDKISKCKVCSNRANRFFLFARSAKFFKGFAPPLP